MRDARATVGIQGGRGSFNDSAIRDYLAQHRQQNWEVRYLHTTAGVFEALGKREIDFGQFAVYNTVGGLYQESLEEIAANVFDIVEQYALPIAHALMIRKDVAFENVDRIISHAEVYKQCRECLASEYPDLACEVGTGELTDPASVARALDTGELPATVAVLSNRRLAELYNLRVVVADLQDRRDSASTFLLVRRRNDRAILPSR
jgi:prephenate dehydratase